ncbi:MAG: protein-disulfide reductase DsbD domain-containing protein, partial [Streptosporangiaceae bacterium]
MTASLVSDAATITPGQPFTVALRLQHEPHWHSYWIAPGTGYATSITWTLPAGFKAGDIQWPTPHRLLDATGKIVGNGYSDEAFLLVEITPPALPGFRTPAAAEAARLVPGGQQAATGPLAPGATVTLQAAVDWLMCQDVCMPGDAKLAISFPVGPAQADPAWTAALAAARAQLPVADPRWNLSASRGAKTITLRVTPQPGNTHQPEDLRFFAADGLTDYTAPGTVTREQGGWVISKRLDAAADPKTARLTGVLSSANGWHDGAGFGGLVVDVPLTDEAGRGVASAPSPANQVSHLPSQSSP